MQLIQHDSVKCLTCDAFSCNVVYFHCPSFYWLHVALGVLHVVRRHADVQALRSNSPVGGKPSVGVKPVFPPKPGTTSSNDVTMTRSEESLKDPGNVETSVG